LIFLILSCVANKFDFDMIW